MITISCGRMVVAATKSTNGSDVWCHHIIIVCHHNIQYNAIRRIRYSVTKHNIPVLTCPTQ